MSEHTVILFYKYVAIADPEKEKVDQLALCTKLGLKGRIIIAREGINATLEGTKENIEAYCTRLLSNDLFKGTHIKKSEGNGKSFPRLSVKVRPEIVTAKLPNDVDPTRVTGKRLSPETLHQWIQEGRKFKIIDMRNDYEFKSGHFEGSHFSGMKNFRDLKDVPQNLANLKEETTVTVCTGGVRCEKASGHLIQSGWKDVYQLDGGIVSYMEKYPGHAFKGTLYVFDDRITMDFDDTRSHTMVGKCERCSKPSENYINCALDECHIHFICCDDCFRGEGETFCSEDCEKAQKSLVKI